MRSVDRFYFAKNFTRIVNESIKSKTPFVVTKGGPPHVIFRPL
jgi:hypothetical protein